MTRAHLEQRATQCRHQHRHLLSWHDHHSGSESQVGELQRCNALLGDCDNFSLFTEEQPPDRVSSTDGRLQALWRGA